MKKRDDITIRFADNGIIVTPVHRDYSRPTEPCLRDELVFNSVVEFEKWFEHHTGDDNDHWPRTMSRISSRVRSDG
jgi:hypothetical protein